MTADEARQSVSEYWFRKADAALASARSERTAGRLDFAANRDYYACFYAASALLLRMGHKFVKHSGVRAAVHKHLVKAGLLGEEAGRAYDRVFENRQLADYLELYELTDDQVADLIQRAEMFVVEIRQLTTTIDTISSR
jgi:uncharacterized protein (UPF0332 family)